MIFGLRAGARVVKGFFGKTGTSGAGEGWGLVGTLGSGFDSIDRDRETKGEAWMNATIAQATMLVYALLVAAGGVAGYLKAGSRASMIAGLGTATALLVGLGLTFLERTARAGLIVGAVTALAMLAFFGARYAKSRKMMPAGMMTGASAAALAVLGLALLL